MDDATVERVATVIGSQTSESISIVSPVPVGRIKIGPVGGTILVDNLVY